MLINSYKMKKTRFYVVKKGRTPGIYFNWIDCDKQVNKYPGNEFKSFDSINDAINYLNSDKKLFLYKMTKAEKSEYKYNDKILIEQEFSKFVKFRVLSNEKGTFVDIRRYFKETPTKKGIRIPAEEFDTMVKLFKASYDELPLDEEKKTETSQVLKPTPTLANKRIKK